MNIRRMQVPEKQRDEELHFDLDKEFNAKDWDEMRKQLDQDRVVEKWNDFLQLAVDMRFLNPKEPIHLSSEEWEKLKGLLAVNDMARAFWNAAQTKKEMRIGSSFVEDLDPGVGLKEIETYREQDGWYQFAESAALLRIARGITVPINAEEWEMMHEVLSADQLAGWWKNAAHIGASMKILAAHEVKLDDKGLQLTMEKPRYQERSESMPESLSI